MLPPATRVFKANSRTSLSKVRLENSKYHYKWVHSSQNRPYLLRYVCIKPTVILFNKGIHIYCTAKYIWPRIMKVAASHLSLGMFANLLSSIFICYISPNFPMFHFFHNPDVVSSHHYTLIITCLTCDSANQML